MAGDTYTHQYHQSTEEWPFGHSLALVSLESLLGLFTTQRGDKDIKKAFKEVRVTGRQKVKGLPQIIGLLTVKYCASSSLCPLTDNN